MCDVCWRLTQTLQLEVSRDVTSALVSPPHCICLDILSCQADARLLKHLRQNEKIAKNPVQPCGQMTIFWWAMCCLQDCARWNVWVFNVIIKQRRMKNHIRRNVRQSRRDVFWTKNLLHWCDACCTEACPLIPWYGRARLEAFYHTIQGRCLMKQVPLGKKTKLQAGNAEIERVLMLIQEVIMM